MATRRAAAAGIDGPVGESTDPESAARAICLRLLTARPCSRAELAAALGRKGVPMELADRVLERFGELGLVDDSAYAEMVVRSGYHHRLLGRRALSAELRRRGVDDGTAGDALATIDPSEEEQAARRLVERKLRTMTGFDDGTRVRQLVSLLARRGYPEGLAYRVIREMLRERGCAADLPDPEHVT